MVRPGTESHSMRVNNLEFCKVIQIFAGVSQKIAKGSFHLENPTQ